MGKELRVHNNSYLVNMGRSSEYTAIATWSIWEGAQSTQHYLVNMGRSLEYTAIATWSIWEGAQRTP